jgi:hypothetical protein
MRNLFPSNVFIINVLYLSPSRGPFCIRFKQSNLVKNEVNIDYVDFNIHLTFKVNLWISGYGFEDQDLYQNVPVPVLGPERLTIRLT